MGSLHRIGQGDDTENDCFVLRLDAQEPELAWFWLEVRWDPMWPGSPAIAGLVEDCPVLVKGRAAEKGYSKPVNGAARSGFVVETCGEGLRITHTAVDAAEFQVRLAGMTGPRSLKGRC